MNTDKKRYKPVKFSDNKIKALKHFSFFDYIKSVLIRNNNNGFYFIRIFRKHLLSEEHLLKCHIKMIFIEKKFNYEGNENTNYLECFNEL